MRASCLRRLFLAAALLALTATAWAQARPGSPSAKPLPLEPPVPGRRVPLGRLYRRLESQVRTSPAHIRAALPALHYFGMEHPGLQPAALLYAVRPLSGESLDVVCLDYFTGGSPGAQGSVAFLARNGRLVDWTAWWSGYRLGDPWESTRLEDVDGDGKPDLAFRADISHGWPLQPEGLQSRPGDPRRWFRAYRIAAGGFESIFRAADKDHRVRVVTDTVGLPVRLRVSAVPSAVPDNQMVELSVRVTNTSGAPVRLRRDGWLSVDVRGGGWFGAGPIPYSHRSPIAPGRTVMARFFFVLVPRSTSEPAGEVVVNCALRPGQ